MKAKLLRKGKTVSIYALENRDRCEVLDFLKKNKNTKLFNVSGFIKILNTIADDGYVFPKEVFKSWEEQGEQFFEIIKGDYRISCFKYEINGKKLLLITQFGKTRNKQSNEYNRAINLKKAFDLKPLWED